MHPNPAFRWPDVAAMRAFVRDATFGSLFVQTPAGPRAVHAPAVVLDADALGLHFSRSNAASHPGLAGQTALFVVQGPHAYVSPDWYGLGPDEVPTWNYLAVEVEGTLEPMTRDDLIAQLDQLGHEQEARLAPKTEWTRDKADPARIDAMLNAIQGWRLNVTEWRGSRKIGQNKPAAARRVAAQALAALGQDGIARAMRDGL
ncbi:FMN-binding negative transcriptional regulator [Sphingomonas sp.]|uniref:FMN-binding negative transcriptional regulator n=1 Tax=Sphingomonas sp. TaxID=28214 RepID=UPI001EBA32D0|nr:FMN-binding negative transcriptional regulator [Sphingomonas sp.]MBX3594236.1 FMN-binding negative transcriptional regulator [Sphingomonas sp.]